jgi:hypothetical protein
MIEHMKVAASSGQFQIKELLDLLPYRLAGVFGCIKIKWSEIISQPLT